MESARRPWYAIDASMIIRSAADTTRGHIILYVVDCGLTPENSEGLKRTCDRNSDATMVFFGLPRRRFSERTGVLWAKFDMLKVSSGTRTVLTSGLITSFAKA